MKASPNVCLGEAFFCVHQLLVEMLACDRLKSPSAATKALNNLPGSAALPPALLCSIPCDGVNLLDFGYKIHTQQTDIVVKYWNYFLKLGIYLSIILVAFSLVADAIGSDLADSIATGAEIAEDHEGHAEDAESGDDKGSHGIVGDLMTLGFLILLQAVLGFDNLLYISLESKNAPVEKRKMVRAWGIGLAIALRIILLFALYYAQDYFEKFMVFSIGEPLPITGSFNLHSLIVLAGGAFILYTAMKEIWHMTRLEHDHHDSDKNKTKSAGAAIFWIMVMNAVFSIDSILSAMALTDVLWVMATAVILSGLAMIWLADHVSEFLNRNRMYEVLGLFVLFVVGIMLVSEGGHLAHLKLFGSEVTPMTKATFYFVLAILVLTDIVQGRYQKKLLAQAARDSGKTASHA